MLKRIRLEWAYITSELHNPICLAEERRIPFSLKYGNVVACVLAGPLALRRGRVTRTCPLTASL